MLITIWRKGNTCAVLVEMWIGPFTMENSMEILQKLKLELSYDLAIPPLDIHPKKKEKENTNLKRYIHPNVHSSTIYNSQDMEAP